MSDKIGQFGMSDVVVITLILAGATTGIVFTVKQIKKNNERKKQVESVLNASGEANPSRNHFYCAANGKFMKKENSFCASGKCTPPRVFNGIFCELPPELRIHRTSII